MTRHPNKSPDQEGHVRKRAHAIWEKEGRPHGKEKEHWEKALQEVGAEKDRDSSRVKNKKQSAGTGGSSAKRKPPSPR